MATKVPVEEPDFEYEDTGKVEDRKVELGGLFFEEEFMGNEDDESGKSETEESISLAELREQNKQLEERLVALSGQVTNFQGVQQSISQLGERMAAPAAPEKQPGESDEAFQKRINESLYENPYENLEAWGQRRVLPFFQQVMQQNLDMRKQILALDPEKGKLFQRYGKEIEKELEAMPPQQRFQDPNALMRAYRLVVAEHVDEIFEERQKKDDVVEVETKPVTRSSSAPYGATSTSRSKPGETKSSSSEMKIPDYVKDFALKRGFSEKDAYAYMKANGMLRSKA